MSTRYLEHLFRPRSVAVIGASDRAGSVGRAIFSNLVDGGFEGRLDPVNLRHRRVGGYRCYHRVADLPEPPELGVICTPAPSVPGLIAELGQVGTRAAVIVTAGFETASREAGRDLEGELLENAGRHGLRFLGPNCVGLLVPGHGLNASFAHTGIHDGRLAFVSQSGALATAVLDWAAERDIGFSSFVSLGNCLDIDIGDVIDYLGIDGRTRSTLLYMESTRRGRKFMSAMRAAARNKPLIVVKSGRAPEGARAAASHTGALAGSDVVYEAAIRRSGALRVHGIEDLFGMAEVLSKVPGRVGPKLAILTNGGGPGILATDELVLGGGSLAEPSDATIERLDAILPDNWSRANPIDIIGDAPPERFCSALGILLEDEGVDAVLVIHAPTALSPAEPLAEALAETAAEARKPVLGCWLGGGAARRASEHFAAAGLPGFSSPEDAVSAYLNLLEYHANQSALIETPGEVPTEARIDRDRAAAIVADAAGAGRARLTEVDAMRLLEAYGVPCVPTHGAADAEEAVEAAERIGYPVALKIMSPDISHKSDFGGVALGLESAPAVRDAARRMEGLLSSANDSRQSGYCVQAMAPARHGVELIVGTETDPVFGPVVLFGQGGTAVEVIRDTVIGLPPLNMSLSRQLVERTRVARQLAGYRDRPAARIDLVCDVLVRVARLMCDLPGIRSLDINPLIADGQGVLAVDARVLLREPDAGESPPPAIAPYPSHLEEWVEFDGENIQLRPIRPEDEPAHREFFQSLTAEDIRFRFFGVIREPEHSQLARYTQIDYDREMAFVAVDGDKRILGVARLSSDRAHRRGEFAIVVRSGIKGRGLGRILLEKLMRYSAGCGQRELIGQVLFNNTRMLNLARELGFKVRHSDPADLCEVVLEHPAAEGNAS
ncbi:MAG: GNAT family N-acetyltransferase [Gammaproteobacteria bacterium]|jgi:acetyltransferase|nr:GNAT family N-acetyltransferase [Gammaproteobacteria bacterium]